jgi:hypothetical protein
MPLTKLSLARKLTFFTVQSVRCTIRRNIFTDFLQHCQSSLGIPCRDLLLRGQCGGSLFRRLLKKFILWDYPFNPTLPDLKETPAFQELIAWPSYAHTPEWDETREAHLRSSYSWDMYSTVYIVQYRNTWMEWKIWRKAESAWEKWLQGGFMSRSSQAYKFIQSRARGVYGVQSLLARKSFLPYPTI